MVQLAAFIFNVFVIGWVLIFSFKYIIAISFLIFLMWDDIIPFIQGALSAL